MIVTIDGTKKEVENMDAYVRACENKDNTVEVFIVRPGAKVRLMNGKINNVVAPGNVALYLRKYGHPMEIEISIRKNTKLETCPDCGYPIRNGHCDCID